MLSYQHAYHAGCRADMHKHAALCVLLSCLIQKDKPLTYMETHAGRGLYDLCSAEAEKTGEAKAGILTLESTIPADHPYARMLQTHHTAYGATSYPGSPFIAKQVLRAFDVMHLMELHPQEYKALKQAMRGSHIHKRDGYEGVLSLSPPHPRRGVVLIDPSYEVKSEYQKAADFIIMLHRKWPEAVIMLWYPLLPTANHRDMLGTLLKADLPKCWHQEITWAPQTPKAMQGSGLIIINTPHNAVATLDINILLDTN